MGNFLGYGLQAGVRGFQSGFNMGQMKWQQNEKKRLQKKQDEMMEIASIYNNMVATAGDDGEYSDDDMMKISTGYMALSYQVKEMVKGTYDAIQALDKKTTEQNNQKFDLLLEATKGMDEVDADYIFETILPFISGEKPKQILEAYRSIVDKRRGITKEEQTWERGRTVPSENRAEWFRQQGIEIPEAEPEVKAPSVTQQKYDWATEAHQKWLIDPKDPSGINFEEYKKYMGVSVTDKEATGLKKRVQDIAREGERAGIDPAKITKAIQDEILGSSKTTTTEKPETVGTLKNWEKMFDVNDEAGPRTEEDYNRALDLLAQSEDKYKPKYPTWKEALIAEVKGIGKELEGIKDRTDRLFLLDVYKQKIEEIKAKYPDVDLSQFTQPKEMSGWDKFLEGIGF